MVKFGGPVFLSNNEVAGTEKSHGENQGLVSLDPELLVAKHKEKGFKSAYVPNIDLKDTVLIKATRAAFEREGIVLAEAGYWENIMDSDEATRNFHRGKMVETFYLAEELGARCAVNIFGSYCYGNGNSQHSGKNFSDDAFAEAVDMARYFIDTVKPKTTYFTYEIFPFNIVDSVDSMEKLIKAVDRKMFGVHFDLCNLINDPRKYFYHVDVLNEVINKLGKYIVSAHIKDIKLKEPAISVILEEVPPGEGIINFGALFKAINELPGDVPALMEHLNNEGEYDAAAAYIRSEVKKVGIDI